MPKNEDFYDVDKLLEDSFIERMEEIELKKRIKTFNMGHDEDMDYNCVKCNKAISAHNNDWHARMCDDCYDEFFSDYL